MSRLFQQKGEFFLNHALSMFFNFGYPVAAEKDDLVRLNSETEEFGLSLSGAQAVDLAQTHRLALSASGRIEIGTGAVEKIIRKFSRSHYLWQQDYAETLNEAVEAFYELKNETEDRISDSDLIGILFKGFEQYKGALGPFLQSRELDRLLRELRFDGYADSESDFTDIEEEEDENE